MDRNSINYLECKNLYKDWGGATIDVSFSLHQGTFTSLVGPSGSGKSTVLRLIAGLIPNNVPPGRTPQIMLDGRDITRLPPGQRGCGMVFQNGALFPHLTVQDNVGYGLRCQGTGKRQSRAQAADYLRKFHIEGLARRHADTLSGGEAQRVALARTLIVRPKLVLLDEPMSALDPSLRQQLAGEIRTLQREQGFTAIMVTHDLDEAKAMSDRIIFMKKGRTLWDGGAQDFPEGLLASSEGRCPGP